MWEEKKERLRRNASCARGEEDGMDKKRKAVSPGGGMAFARVVGNGMELSGVGKAA